MSLIDQVIAGLEFIEVLPDSKVYAWHPEEEAILKKYYGKLSRPEIAARITAVLRRLTGDPEAERTIDACCNHAQNLGLRAYNGDDEYLCCKEASRSGDVLYVHLMAAIKRGDLSSERRGKGRYINRREFAIWLVDYRERR